MASVFNHFMDRFLAALLATLIASVSWQVVSRYALGSPSEWTEELARFLLIWVGLLGGAYAFRTQAHLGLELLATRLSGAARALHTIVLNLLIIVFAAAVLVFGGSKLMHLTWVLHQTSAALEVPMAAVYAALPLSGLMLIATAVGNILPNRNAGASNHD